MINKFLNSVGAALCGRPLKGRFPHLGVHRGTPLHNSRGISVLFLVIAMLLMVTIGYVLSYLIPTKQKSVSPTIYSSQAFYLAQSGAEFAVRYASDTGWTTPAQLINLTGLTRNLGGTNGRFTLNYDSAQDRLTSVGEIPTLSQRGVIISNFTSFLQQRLILVPGSPCWIALNERVRIDIRNESGSNITIRSFQASWTQTQNTRLRDILMGPPPPPPLSSRFSGNYGSGDPPTNLDSSQTVAPSQDIRVDVRWQHNRVSGNIIFTFYTGLNGTGDSYSINVGSPTSNCP